MLAARGLRARREWAGSGAGLSARASSFAGTLLPRRANPSSRCARRRASPGGIAAEFSLLPGGQLPAALSTHDADTKEASRSFRRTVFDFDAWTQHRSTSRYNRHLKGMFTSRMVRGLQRPILTVVGIAAAVCTYESLRSAGVLPGYLPDLELNSKEPFTLTAFALSLLLVFRTNSSYSRWLDARKTWGLVLNRSRDIVRQGLTYIPEERAHLRGMLCRWVPAFSRALMCHVRADGNLELELQCVLLPHEIEALLGSAGHAPNYVLQARATLCKLPAGGGVCARTLLLHGMAASWREMVLSTIVGRAALAPPLAQRMDENLTAFEDCLGTCERILKTPIPLSYTRHTARFMMIWLALLPLMLHNSCGWATVPLIALIAFLLLGIEEIGVSIEEPFSILPLEAISDSVLNNVRELQATHGGGGAAAGRTGMPRVSAAQLVDAAEAAAAVGAGAENGRPLTH